MTGLRLLRSPAAAAIAALFPAAVVVGATADHAYDRYAKVIRDHVRMPLVDYSALKKGRAALDAAVDAFAQATEAEERAWTREQRLAFWINAYNAFTLRAIVDHYPIRAPWLTLQPRNSIRQIDGVWTKLEWRAAGRTITLDGIEHGLLRPEFADARVHMAINCASKSCPPLRAEPYVGADLDHQLDDAARGYLASAEGARVEDGRLYLSKIFEWYGSDFVKQYAASGDTEGATERGVRGFVERYGAPDAAAAAKAGAKIRFLDYDWSLNDVQ